MNRSTYTGYMDVNNSGLANSTRAAGIVRHGLITLSWMQDICHNARIDPSKGKCTYAHTDDSLREQAARLQNLLLRGASPSLRGSAAEIGRLPQRHLRQHPGTGVRPSRSERRSERRQLRRERRQLGAGDTCVDCGSALGRTVVQAAREFAWQAAGAMEASRLGPTWIR